MNFFNKLREAPIHWLIVSIILNIFGLIALFSISSGADQLSYSSRFFKFLFWFGPALGGFLLFFIIPKRFIHEYAYVALTISILALFLPYFSEPIAGTYRWVSFGGISFQPAEILKWIMVIALARYLSDNRLQLKKVHSLFAPIFFVLCPAFFIAKQPDLGSAVILVAPIIPLLYWVGARPFHIFLLTAPIISVLTAFNYYTFTSWILIIGVVVYLSQTNLRVMLVNFFVSFSVS